MKLNCLKGDHNTAKVIALMMAVDVSAELVFIDPNSSNGRLSLEDESQTSEPLYDVNTILRFIARSFRDKGFAGILPKEEAQIDQWLSYTSTNLDPLVSYIYNVYNKGTGNTQNFINVLKELSLELAVLEKKLEGTHFLVGYGATLADLSIAVCLTSPLYPVYNKYFAYKYPNLTSYLTRIATKFRLDKLPNNMSTLAHTNSEIETAV